MKCQHCDETFSDSVIPYHEERCEQNPANFPVEREEEKDIDKKIEDMTIPELKVVAEKNNIDIGGLAKKDEILAAILAAKPNGD
ncbi:hypothetical protein [Cohnella silvisoli]|uniref:Rho termination factor N-terminal domain-containing protein n=1 Tax=Cohnella silvisoli TaxID=2873699 RepID=A0ABV1L396_9BACL|nr:hypothetical protein [Cohnella silvisoli]MCD9026042.1 hypothetical protein [Cohnella silvisoli]